MLKEAFTIHSISDPIVLPAGSFVKPIETRYLPPHVLKDPKNKYFTEKTEVICYTRLGMVAIPRNIIREV